MIRNEGKVNEGHHICLINEDGRKLGQGSLRIVSIFLLFVSYSWALDGGLWVCGLRERVRELIVWMNQGLTSFWPEKQCSGLIQPSSRKCMMCKNPNVFLKSKYRETLGLGQEKEKCGIVWESEGITSLLSFSFPTTKLKMSVFL